MAEATLRMLLLGEDRSAGRTLKSVGDQSDKTGGKLRGLGNVAGKVLAGGFLIAGAAAVKFTRRAAEDQAAQVRLANTMRNAAGAKKSDIKATEDWITAQGKALGVADDDLRPALGKLVAATHDVGKAQSLASLAMDVSAGTGKSLESVSMALAKAQNGNTSGLGRLGVAVKDADGKTKSLKQITKDLADTYGGAASKNAETAEGKQRRLSVALSEAGETIGYKLIPVMLTLVDAGTSVLTWMEKNQKLVVIFGGALAGLVTLVWGINAAAKAYRATQAALNIVLTANPIGLIIVALGLLVVALVVAYKKSETFRTIVNAAFRAVGDAFVAIWNGFLAPIFQLYGKAIGVVLHTWASLLSLLGKVPGFGWAKDLANKLDNAADAASNLNLKLDRATRDRDVHVRIHADNLVLQRGPGGLPIYNTSSHAVGARFFGGGWTTLNERGPENVWLPRGSRIDTAQQSARGGTATTVRHEHVLIVKYPDGRVLRTILLDDKDERGIDLGLT